MIKNAGEIEIGCEGKNLVVALGGEIDHHNAAFLRTRIDKLIYEKKPPKLILDLSAIEFMDNNSIITVEDYLDCGLNKSAQCANCHHLNSLADKVYFSKRKHSLIPLFQMMECHF